jgi:hypothetical protein
MSRVKFHMRTMALFGRAPALAPRAAPARALPNDCFAPAPIVEPVLEPAAALKGEEEPGKRGSQRLTIPRPRLPLEFGEITTILPLPIHGSAAGRSGGAGGSAAWPEEARPEETGPGETGSGPGTGETARHGRRRRGVAGGGAAGGNVVAGDGAGEEWRGRVRRGWALTGGRRRSDGEGEDGRCGGSGRRERACGRVKGVDGGG